ncbi:hypothetical protein SI65_04285 [Aspergillus cristatus]|uniref:CN hydrolase domain-containing protein n=1 Tax=Aspergillus cristatus TaxID=573508 RepID=A0A1E3BJS3_ASPCR|nr:hypothetical protein SI65_04285 [Aspergillus cristatus]
MAPIRRVAVAQWYIKDLAIDENHAKACQYIREATAQGAELVVLPEYHLNGFNPSDPLYIHQTTTYTPYLQTYQSLARELSISLVPGTIVENHSPTPAHNENEKPLLYNTAYFIAPTGEILGSYRKKNIWHPEREYLTSSGEEPHEVIETPVGKIGLLVCWDLAFPEAFRELIAQGAELIIIPTFWSRYDASPEALQYNRESEVLFLESTLTARTFENTCGIIFANVAGGPGDQYFGLSRVVLPVTGVVGDMGNKEGVMVVDMDVGLVRIAEENYKVRQDIKKEGWHYVYRHSAA